MVDHIRFGWAFYNRSLLRHGRLPYRSYRESPFTNPVASISSSACKERSSTFDVSNKNLLVMLSLPSSLWKNQPPEYIYIYIRRVLPSHNSALFDIRRTTTKTNRPAFRRRSSPFAALQTHPNNQKKNSWPPIRPGAFLLAIISFAISHKQKQNHQQRNNSQTVKSSTFATKMKCNLIDDRKFPYHATHIPFFSINVGFVLERGYLSRLTSLPRHLFDWIERWENCQKLALLIEDQRQSVEIKEKWTRRFFATLSRSSSWH